MQVLCFLLVKFWQNLSIFTVIILIGCEYSPRGLNDSIINAEEACSLYYELQSEK